MARFFLSVLMIFLGLSLNSYVIGTQDPHPLASSLAVCYLRAVKQQRNDSAHKNDTITQVIFGKEIESAGNGKITMPGVQASFHDVTLSVERKKSHGKEEVTLTARVFGAPEEFEGENVLASEKALVKYRIISAYLAYRTKMSELFFGWLRSDDMLDKTTRVASSPSNYSEPVLGIYPYTRRVYKDKYEMRVSSTFTAPEFDALIQKHCAENSANV